jgi:hypothetical protein
VLYRTQREPHSVLGCLSAFAASRHNTHTSSMTANTVHSRSTASTNAYLATVAASNRPTKATNTTSFSATTPNQQAAYHQSHQPTARPPCLLCEENNIALHNTLNFSTAKQPDTSPFPARVLLLLHHPTSFQWAPEGDAVCQLSAEYI